MSNEAIHHTLVRPTGMHWWIYTFWPRQPMLRRFARELFDMGRTSFTLPDGSNWKILGRGKVEPMKRPDLGGAGGF